MTQENEVVQPITGRNNSRSKRNEIYTRST
jgi:hypothetical protein